MRDNSNLETLPSELLKEILYFLAPWDILKITLINKALTKVKNFNPFWKKKIDIHFSKMDVKKLISSRKDINFTPYEIFKNLYDRYKLKNNHLPTKVLNLFFLAKEGHIGELLENLIIEEHLFTKAVSVTYEIITYTLLDTLVALKNQQLLNALYQKIKSTYLSEKEEDGYSKKKSFTYINKINSPLTPLLLSEKKQTDRECKFNILFWALTLKQNTCEIETLIKNGSKIYEKSSNLDFEKYSEKKLQIAIQNKNIEIIRLLVESKGGYRENYSHTDEDVHTARFIFRQCIYYNNFEALKYFVDEWIGGKLKSDPDFFSEIFTLALEKNNKEIVKYLFELREPILTEENWMLFLMLQQIKSNILFKENIIMPLNF